MKINRAKFIQHLERLRCAGQVTEAVFTDAFAAAAWPPDHLLLVIAPEFDGAEPLDEEVGIVDLSTLAGALKLAPGEGNEGVDVDVYIKDNRLVVDDEERGESALLTSAAKNISTRIEAATVEKILKGMPDGDEVELTQAALVGVQRAWGLFKAEQVQIQVGPDGVELVVGNDTTHRSKFPLADKPAPKAGYALLFGKHLIDVFSIITDYSSATLTIAGPDQPVLIEDGEFKYVLSPRKPPADAATKKAEKAEKKSRKKAEPAGAAAE